jgi:hypothetical protein
MLQQKLFNFNERLNLIETNLAIVLKFMEKILHDYSEFESDDDSDEMSDEKTFEEAKKVKKVKKVKKKVKKIISESKEE